MPYYDDRDYFYDSDSIDELYEDDMIFEDEQYEDNASTSWEYDYHNITDEIIDE